MQGEEVMRKKEIKTNKELRLEEAQILKENWKKRRNPNPETENGKTEENPKVSYKTIDKNAGMAATNIKRKRKAQQKVSKEDKKTPAKTNAVEAVVETEDKN